MPPCGRANIAARPGSIPAMPKAKTLYVCTACGTRSHKWQGQCTDCGAWNSLTESTALPQPRLVGASQVRRLADIEDSGVKRIQTGISELDRVLGAGIVPGSVSLVGGDPGIGKSTLMLQAMAQLAGQVPALYVTGEESAAQVAARGRRLGLDPDRLGLLAENRLEYITAETEATQPQAMVVDTIQTVVSSELPSAAGTVSQVRECAQRLVSLAKGRGMALFLIGHVTKDGTIAGPRLLEHMVDTVLYFESEPGSRFRIVRAVKNRFGPVSEIGVFAMTEQGLKEVRNPSAMFLTGRDEAVPGSVVTVAREGSRSLLVEVQALVDESLATNPRRVTVGLDQNRLAMLLAALHRHAGIAMYNQDVFVNVVGGLRISETSADLPTILAACGSFRDKAIAAETVVFGEVGLSGELRPVSFGEERLQEAARHGFSRAIVPAANVPRRTIKGLEVAAASRLGEAIEQAF